MSGYRGLADDLRRRIDAGEFAVGEKLPSVQDLMESYSLARQTVRDAIGLLADDGLVVAIERTGTVVRHRTPVHLPLSRYGQVMAPGAGGGPWETATAAQGLDGVMTLVSVDQVQADQPLADLLQLQPGDALVYRLRHAVIRPDDVVQLQHAWYPRDIAEAAGIAGTAKVEGGIFRALTAAGFRPSLATESVESRPPTDDEARTLRIGGRVQVLTVERVTRDETGRALEVLRVVAPADRIRLTYDNLPL